MCMGFRIGEVSYISDASKIPEETKAKVEGSRVLILDALREKPHGSHFSFDEVPTLTCGAGLSVGKGVCDEFGTEAGYYLLGWVCASDGSLCFGRGS